MLNVNTNTIKSFLTKTYLRKNLRLEIYFSNVISQDTEYITINNNHIVSESFQLEQSLCDGEADYTGCVSSSMEISIMNDSNMVDVGYLKYGNGVRVYLYSPDDEFEEMLLFTGYIDSLESSYSSKEIRLHCYDIFGMWMSDYSITEALISEFSNKTSIMAIDILNILRNRYARYGVSIITGSDSPLVNMNFSINRYDIFGKDGNNYTNLFPEDFKDIEMLKYICQLNGVYGIVDNNGDIRFKQYNENGVVNIDYPEDDFYPSGPVVDYLYVPFSEFKFDPLDNNVEKAISGVSVMETDDSKVDSFDYKVITQIEGLEYEVQEDMVSSLSQGVHIYECLSVNEGQTTWSPGGTSLPGDGLILITNIGKCKVGDTILVQVSWKKRKVNVCNRGVVTDDDLGETVFKIKGNPLIHNKEYSDKTEIALNVYNKVSNHSYEKFEASCIGLPFIEVGDYINLKVRNMFAHSFSENEFETKKCLIFNRTLKGIQFMTDTYSANIFDENDYESRTEYVHYIDSMSGLSGNDSDSMSDTYSNEYSSESTDDRFDDANQNLDNNYYKSEEVDKLIDGGGSSMKIECVTSIPETFAPNTIYFVRK